MIGELLIIVSIGAAHGQYDQYSPYSKIILSDRDAAAYNQYSKFVLTNHETILFSDLRCEPLETAVVTVDIKSDEPITADVWLDGILANSGQKPSTSVKIVNMGYFTYSSTARLTFKCATPPCTVFGIARVDCIAHAYDSWLYES